MMLVKLLVVLVLLGGSPAARAVDCVMGRTPDAHAMAGMPADCPMLRQASEANLSTSFMTVADCFSDVGLLGHPLDAHVQRDGFLAAIVPLPVALPTSPARGVRWEPRPPPLTSARFVLLTSGRWRL